MNHQLLPFAATLRRVSLSGVLAPPLPDLTPLSPSQVLSRLRSLGLDPLAIRWSIEDCEIESNWHYPVDG